MLPFEPWSCCASPPGTITHPDQLDDAKVDWLPAMVPGTVAAALHAAGRWSYDRPADLDGQDWWYRTTFEAPDGPVCRLCLDGLATLAEIWLNGRLLLTTDNMFRAYRIDVAPHLRPRNELRIGFRSLTEDLEQEAPSAALEDQPGKPSAASLAADEPAGTHARLVAAHARGRPVAERPTRCWLLLRFRFPPDLSARRR